MDVKSHKDLMAWQKAMDLTILSYDLTDSLPQEERFGLVSQMRRTAVAIPSNIAQGAGRNSPKEFCKFLNIALGSLAELDTQLTLAHRLCYLDSIEEAAKRISALRKLLTGLIASLKN